MSWLACLGGFAVVLALVVVVFSGVIYLLPHGLILALYPHIPGIAMDSQRQDPLSDWSGPRKVTLQRKANGFGFTLRHFIVYPPESAVAELNRLQDTGGDGPKQRSRISALEPMDTIFVKQVKADGPAHQAGLSNGDRIVSVNGESVTGKTYQQVVNLIQLCDSNLTLFVVPREEDILQVAYPSSAYKPVNRPTHQSRPAEITNSTPSEQTKRTADHVNQNVSIDEHDIMVVGRVESEDTESVKEKSDVDLSNGESTTRSSVSGGLHKKSDSTLCTSTPISDSYRNVKHERTLSDSRHSYKVQRVKASTISHESASPMKVTLVNPPQQSGDSPTHGLKEQRPFRLTNVLNSQTSTKPPCSNLSSSVSDSQTGQQDVGNERQDSQSAPHRHVASLRSYYEDAKLANANSSAEAKSSPVVPLDTSEMGRSSNRGYSSSVDNLLSQSGFTPAQNVLRIQPQRGMNGSSSYDDLLVTGARSDVGRQNRQVSIIGGQSVKRTDREGSKDGSIYAWQNDQESVKVSRSTGTGTARITLKVDDPDVREALAKEAARQRDEYTSHATRVTVSASVSADNLAYSTRNVYVRNTCTESMTVSTTSPKHEARSSSKTLTVTHDSFHRNTLSISSSALTPSPLSQSLASGRLVHLQHQVLPDKPQDSIAYWDKKAITSGSGDMTTEDRVETDGLFLFPWKRTGSRRGSSGSEGSNGRSTTSSQGKQKPPVPKRDSSRSRVRERSLERDKQRERDMHARHRSRSVDRAQRPARSTNWSQYEAYRKNATDALPEGIQLDENSVGRTARKDSSASSNSGSSQSGEKDFKSFPANLLKSWRPRSMSFDYKEPRPQEGSQSAIVRYGSWSAKRGSGGKMKELSIGRAYRRLVQMKEGHTAGRQRLVRRTSYLRATGSDGEEEEEHGDTGSVSSSQEGERPAREKITPKRNASIRKLKSFFGEGTPKIVEASQVRTHPPTVELLGSGPVVKEGPMNVKLETRDGKRATDRSWKPVWAILKGHTLFLMKEQRDQPSTLSLLEDHPINTQGSMIDIAYDYTKKKNVFRLCTSNTSEYLLQVSDESTMLSWIKVIQASISPEDSEKGLINQELILLKTHQYDTKSAPTHPGKAPSPSLNRKKFFRPSGQAKPRPTAKEEMLAKAKASQSFADRMKRHIRKKGGGGFVHVLDEPMHPNSTFGIPLEHCTSSHSNELVPMVVEICCSIVEAKGMDIVGIYRVPGNTAGISYLKDELKKGLDEIDLTDDRWQDVNVIGSLLKLFFRKLPNPLVPTNQYKYFIEANRKQEPSERMWALRRQIHNLPDHHYETFKYLASHLKSVAANSDLNKMEVRNLAIVFGPTLVRSGDDSMVTMVTDMSDQCKIVESLIQHCDWFFSDDVESQQDVPSDAMRGGDKMSPSSDTDGTDLRPLKTSSTEDLTGDIQQFFNPKDLILSVNAAAQRKLKSSVKSPNKESTDSPKVNYRTGSPDLQLHTIKLKNQEPLHLNIGQSPLTIDVGSGQLLDKSPTYGNTTTSVGKVVLRRNSHNSLESPPVVGSDVGGNSADVESLMQGSVFGSSNRAYHPRSYYQQNFHFGSTRGRKLSDTSDSSSQVPNQLSPVNLDRELKSLTSATAKRDSWVQSDYSKERERIEREHEEALRDLEKEDSTNIEELFKSRDYLTELSAVSNKIMDYTRRGVDSPSANRKHVVDTSEYRTTSSNNNNAFTVQAETKRDSSRKQAVTNGASSRDSPLHIDEGDIESDFVQTMKATFDERLRKVLHHESEDDSSRPGSFVADKEQTQSMLSHTSRADEPRGIHYRSNSVDRPEVMRRLVDSPKREISSTSSSLSGSPTRSVDSAKSTSKTKTSTPQHSPKKCSRIEVILTMEKRETTPTSLRENITNNAQEVARYRKATKSKDTSSIKEKHREMRRRRHTVGGGKDFIDFQTAFNEHSSSGNDSPKMSAVDRLKPFGKENMKSSARPQDMKTWLQTERHRSTNSSPNLLSTVQASIARLHPRETEKQRREKELRRKSTPILGTTDFNNDTQPHKLSRMPKYFEIESYL